MKFRTKAGLGTALLAALTIIAAPSVAMAADEPLVLPAPVQVDGCGPEADPYAAFDIPDVDGAFYGIYDYTWVGDNPSSWMLGEDGYGWEPGDGWLVIATQDNWAPFEGPIAPEGDYALDTAGSPGWWFPDFSDEPCTVTPQAPVWTDAGPGIGNGYWTAPEQEGVTFKVTRYSTGKVKIVASAEPGYVLDGTTQWQRIDR